MLLVKDSKTVNYLAVKRIHKKHSPLELSSSDTLSYNNTIVLCFNKKIKFCNNSDKRTKSRSAHMLVQMQR